MGNVNNFTNRLIVLDSNIWCYYFDESSKEHNAVSAYIDAVIESREIIMSTVIVMELAHFLIKNLGSIKGKEKIEKLLEFPFIIEDFDYDSLFSAIDLLAQYSHTGIGGRDATILAIMKKSGISELVTHDDSFKKIDFIKVIDPIKPPS